VRNVHRVIDEDRCAGEDSILSSLEVELNPYPLSTCAEVTSNHATPEEHVNVQHRCTTSGTQLPRNHIRSWMPEGGGVCEDGVMSFS
jgi:hypothetical protein